MSLSASLFHALTIREPRTLTAADLISYQEGSAERFLSRFGGHLDFHDKTVLDVGCGGAGLCAAVAGLGPKQVTGVDLDIDLAREFLATHAPEAGIELIETDGSLAELGERRFDLILSKDSFEHYADPEGFVRTIIGYLKPGGELVIGFGPLWKSPTGGHIDYMTKLPWAHLLFPEAVIMQERKRFRPDENAHHWSEIKGGLNQMTYGRFLQIVRSNQLECIYLATNVSDSQVVKAMNTVSRVPGLREYFTQSIYAVLRTPA